MSQEVYDNPKISRYALWSVCLMIAMASGCSSKEPPGIYTDTAEIEISESPEDYEDPPFEKIDQELLRVILSDHHDHDDKRIYFLTTTPMAKWGETGNWVSLPIEFHESLENSNYHPASQAYLKDGSVLQKGTDAKGWMRWITIKRRISDSEVEVEEGIWCCPLGGGAHTNVYEKKDGKWRLKESKDFWVS